MGLIPIKVSNTHGGEYHSQCPECGGKDRFIIQPHFRGTRCEGRYKCRQCSKGGDTVSFCIDILKMPFQEAIERANAIVSPVKLFNNNMKPKKIEYPEIYLTPPPKIWVEKATAFTKWAHENLLKNVEMLKYLEQRGIPLDTVVLFKLGDNPETLNRKRTNWGLKVEDETKDIFSLPRGIVIPFVEKSGNVTRLKIRRSVPVKDKRYKVITGSMSGFKIIGDRKLPIMIVVESELDSYALHHAAGHLACIVAVGGNDKNLDSVTADCAREKRKILICHDNDEDNKGLKMFEKWQKIYPHAKPCPTPIGKDIGEAFQQGLDIRKWILENV